MGSGTRLNFPVKLTENSNRARKVSNQRPGRVICRRVPLTEFSSISLVCGAVRFRSVCFLPVFLLTTKITFEKLLLISKLTLVLVLKPLTVRKINVYLVRKTEIKQNTEYVYLKPKIRNLRTSRVTCYLNTSGFEQCLTIE